VFGKGVSRRGRPSPGCRRSAARSRTSLGTAS
jgi:hypothetical protein